MNRQKVIAGTVKPEPGRAYLTHLNDLMAAVEARRDEAKRAADDLRVEIEGLHAAIERRNIDTARANETDTLNIVARQHELDDWSRVEKAAAAAISAAKEDL
jgi:hypothetical protein